MCDRAPWPLGADRGIVGQDKAKGFVDWGYVATISIGKTVEASAFSDDSKVDAPEITGSQETDPELQNKFEDGKKTLSDLLR